MEESGEKQSMWGREWNSPILPDITPQVQQHIGVFSSPEAPLNPIHLGFLGSFNM